MVNRAVLDLISLAVIMGFLFYWMGFMNGYVDGSDWFMRNGRKFEGKLQAWTTFLFEMYVVLIMVYVGGGVCLFTGYVVIMKMKRGLIRV